ncbi:hypothetical protein AVEN_104418-1 [Araneus ventricosus]|uniref:Uncharacterized protein n=1 Tax=Araneus ventricosus TaxID=182803 RepID=A0A4Y2SRY5_ARAVE|nr:hypothetical protein AVEN_104418-1 [Araneus ventricosus]
MSFVILKLFIKFFISLNPKSSYQALELFSIQARLNSTSEKSSVTFAPVIVLVVAVHVRLLESKKIPVSIENGAFPVINDDKEVECSEILLQRSLLAKAWGISQSQVYVGYNTLLG